MLTALACMLRAVCICVHRQVIEKLILRESLTEKQAEETLSVSGMRCDSMHTPTGASASGGVRMNNGQHAAATRQYAMMCSRCE